MPPSARRTASQPLRLPPRSRASPRSPAPRLLYGIGMAASGPAPRASRWRRSRVSHVASSPASCRRVDWSATLLSVAFLLVTNVAGCPGGGFALSIIPRSSPCVAARVRESKGGSGAGTAAGAAGRRPGELLPAAILVALHLPRRHDRLQLDECMYLRTLHRPSLEKGGPRHPERDLPALIVIGYIGAILGGSVVGSLRSERWQAPRIMSAPCVFGPPARADLRLSHDGRERVRARLGPHPGRRRRSPTTPDEAQRRDPGLDPANHQSATAWPLQAPISRRRRQVRRVVRVDRPYDHPVLIAVAVLTAIGSRCAASGSGARRVGIAPATHTQPWC